MSATALVSKRGTNRNNTIDLLRFVFAVIIASFHLINSSGIIPVEEIKNYCFLHANNAVEFYFLVSGFLMALSADKLFSSGVSLEIGTTSVRFLIRKIRTFALPMLAAWIPGFIIYNAFTPNLSALTFVRNLENSLFELLLLRNAGFQGYYVLGQAWYISAMVIVMLICYPLLLKAKNVYYYCIAPATAIFLLGFLNHEYTGFAEVTVWAGIMYKSQIRAFGVINLGVFLYALYRKFKTIELTKTGTALLSIIELICYGLGLYYACAPNIPTRDALHCMILAGGILITFSHRTWIGMITERFPQICSWLGRYSLYLYLGHFAACKKIIPIIAEHFGTGEKTYAIGMLIFFVLALLIMLLEKILRRFLSWLNQKIRVVS